MNSLLKKKLSIVLIVLFSSLFIIDTYPVFAENKKSFSQEEIKKGKKIFKKICSFCHGSEGEGDLEVRVPRIGCHGVINKSNKLLYETIFNGRKGEHGVDMPTFGKNPRTKFEKDLNSVLKESNRFSKKQIDNVLRKLNDDFTSNHRRMVREPDAIKKFGNLTTDQIHFVIAYLRYLETQPVPDECIADSDERYIGNISEGKKIYMDNCRRCHGKDGRGDSFFFEKRIMPRNLTDKVYMNAITDEYIEDVINKGGLKMGRSGIMAPFHFSENEIMDIINYIRTLSQ